MIGKPGVMVRRYLGPNGIDALSLSVSVSGTSCTVSWTAATQTLLTGDISPISYQVTLYDISSSYFVPVLTPTTSSTSIVLNEPASPSGNLYVVGVTSYNTFASGNSESTSSSFSFVR